MADKETGLNISVNAGANEASGAKAAKDLEKKVNNSVKGGRITVPVDITVPIDKDKDKLSQAQSEVVKKIRKLTSFYNVCNILLWNVASCGYLILVDYNNRETREVRVHI